VFNDPREETLDRRSYAELQYGREVGLKGDVLARAYYDGFQCDGEYPLPSETPSDVVMGVATCQGDTVGSELNLTRRVRRQRLVFGAEYRANLRQNMATHLEGLDISMLDVRHHSTAWGLSASDEIQLHPRVVASGALRLDYQTGYDAHLTPRASLVVGPVARTYFKLLFADAFRAPSTNERFFEAPSVVQLNPLLAPETVRSFEGVVEHAVTSAFSLSASVYRTNLDGLITSRVLDSGATQLFNSNAMVDGVELEARAQAGALTGDASYAFLRAIDAAGQPRPGAAPRHQAKLNAVAPLGRHLTGAAQLIWNGSIQAYTGETIESALISNFTLTKQNLWPHVDLGASIYNVFDQQAHDPVSENHVQASVPEYGRRFVGRLTWRF
jgi:iron complex outermembrane receptor protein